LCGAETTTLRKVYQKYLGLFKSVVGGETDQLDGSCKQWSSITFSHRRKEYPTYSKKKES